MRNLIFPNLQATKSVKIKIKTFYFQLYKLFQYLFNNLHELSKKENRLNYYLQFSNEII